MYDWQPVADNSFRDSLKRQKQHAQQEFQTRAQKVIVEFAEQVRHDCSVRVMCVFNALSALAT